jgi:hypothetical protein
MLTAIGSLLIGGFKGMPLGVLSVGILTISFLMFIFIRKPLWLKYLFTTIVLLIACSFTFHFLDKVDYWIIKKEKTYVGDNELYSYLDEIQNDTTIRGYKIFNISEGNKAVVLSLGGGMSGDNIEVLDVEEQNEKTVIRVRSFYNQSTEKNPTIIIGLDRIKSQVEIIDTDGTLYKAVDK